ncbi:unnamed protein product [Gordionus sp. m RMFG-2023]|uniref:proteasome subunit beta type-7-like n=1 Tax=Gordionus sp. m RMFG-2023 TaxID=3053472 RepID=UPI0030E2CD30
MLALNESIPGFNFDNCKRNIHLLNNNAIKSKFIKTGTTIAGAIFKDGVILASDTRATEGDIIAEKECQKLHYLAPNIYAAGCGVAADLHHLTLMISARLELLRMNMDDRQIRVVTVNRIFKQLLFRHGGHLGVGFIIGGVDLTGSHLYSVAPHGSTDKLPFMASGSGTFAALSVLEDRWRPDMNLEDGKKLLCDAITSGILNDLFSGTQVDLCIITKDKSELLRPYKVISEKGKREGNYTFKKGTTAILNQVVHKFKLDIVDEDEIRMDTH